MIHFNIWISFLKWYAYGRTIDQKEGRVLSMKVSKQIKYEEIKLHNL